MMRQTWALAPQVYVPSLCWMVLKGTDKFCTRQKHTDGDHEHEYTGARWTAEQSTAPIPAPPVDHRR